MWRKEGERGRIGGGTGLDGGGREQGRTEGNKVGLGGNWVGRFRERGRTGGVGLGVELGGSD